MSELHPNVLTYLAALDAFNHNDLATLSEHVSADFVYRIPGRSSVAGDFRGVDTADRWPDELLPGLTRRPEIRSDHIPSGVPADPACDLIMAAAEHWAVRVGWTPPATDA